MSLSQYKLTEEQKKEFLQKEATTLNDSEQKIQYQNFVFSQQKGFLDIMNFINKYIFNLKETGKISSFVELRARIKDANSAIINDYKKHKSLDDVFGMELICATDSEIDFLIEELKSFMKVQRFKEHNKPNGYKAKHYYLYLNSDKYDLIYPKDNLSSQEVTQNCSLIPLMEFQLKTIEVAIKSINGSASHSIYKNTDEKEIQDMFNKGKLIVRCKLTLYVGFYG